MIFDRNNYTHPCRLHNPSSVVVRMRVFAGLMSSVTNIATNLPDLATKRGTLATGLGIWNLATFLATFRIKV